MDIWGEQLFCGNMLQLQILLCSCKNIQSQDSNQVHPKVQVGC